jgi:hypothetical protein
MKTTSTGVAAQGTIPLPINQSGSTTSPTQLFAITQTGTGPNGKFSITNSGNSNNALTVSTNGPGIALSAGNTGTGLAGVFFRTSTTGSSATLLSSNAGGGPAVQGRGVGGGRTALFETTNSTNGQPAVEASTLGTGSVAFFHKDSRAAGSPNPVLVGWNSTAGAPAADFRIFSTTNSASALVATTSGTGWAGDFAAGAKGVRITINAGGPGTGLQVVNGTKNAVVGTTTGARDLYTEESTEVWFTDYGFGRVQYGRARILLDPGFAQTVNVEEPYQVFVQAYGDADLYVRERTPLGFEVVFRGGNDRNAEFGYRVVARRRGYEARRLEPAPWADTSVALGPGAQ